jgi:hypothetical protein
VTPGLLAWAHSHHPPSFALQAACSRHARPNGLRPNLAPKGLDADIRLCRAGFVRVRQARGRVTVRGAGRMVAVLCAMMAA